MSRPSNAVDRSPATLACSAEAEGAPRYVVELCLSAVPIDPRSIPSLDIFEVYRLYCDVGNENGRVRHALRLGFFKDTATATAVAKYLAFYFDEPRVLTLGQVEKARSMHLSFKPLKDIGASGHHAVIELTGERPAFKRHPVASPAVAPAAPQPTAARQPTAAPQPTAARQPTAAPRSLLSRILSSR